MLLVVETDDVFFFNSSSFFSAEDIIITEYSLFITSQIVHVRCLRYLFSTYIILLSSAEESSSKDEKVRVKTSPSSLYILRGLIHVLKETSIISCSSLKVERIKSHLSINVCNSSINSRPFWLVN